MPTQLQVSVAISERNPATFSLRRASGVETEASPNTVRGFAVIRPGETGFVSIDATHIAELDSGSGECTITALSRPKTGSAAKGTLADAGSPAVVGSMELPAVVAVSIASPCVVTKAGHGFKAGRGITFTTTGALPTGLAPATHYYVSKAGLTADTFQLTASVRDALLGANSIVTSGTQSGDQSARPVASEPFAAKYGEMFNLLTSTVFNATLELEKSADGGETWTTVPGQMWNAPVNNHYTDSTLGVPYPGMFYRLHMTAWASGAPGYRISNGSNASATLFRRNRAPARTINANYGGNASNNYGGQPNPYPPPAPPDAAEPGGFTEIPVDTPTLFARVQSDYYVAFIGF